MSRGGGGRHLLDPWVRRSPAGTLLTGGAPARMTRLTPGSAALDLLLSGGPATPGCGRLRARLLAAGTIHPVPDRASPSEVTCVVPARDAGPDLGRLVVALRRFGPVIVVDDGSRDGSTKAAERAGALVVENSHRRGPAGARNTGLDLARTETVAFVDADCRSSSGWVARLTALLEAEPELAIAAPRVRSSGGRTPLARYETAFSPLDMGAAPGLVGPGRRLGYLPSAALVSRRSALLEVGGFDPGRRVGEDVDLVLRLLAAGWRVRYSPQLEIEHPPRPTLAALARQRYAYAGSAPALARDHPGAVAPLRADAGLVAAWLGWAAGRRPGLAALALALAAAVRHGKGADERRALAGLALRAQAEGGRQLARALARDWLPLTVLACAGSKRARRLAALALAADLLASGRGDAQREGFLSRAALRQLDNASYAAGLWAGALRERSPAALLPVLGRRRPPVRAARPAQSGSD